MEVRFQSEGASVARVMANEQLAQVTRYLLFLPSRETKPEFRSEGARVARHMANEQMRIVTAHLIQSRKKR